MRKYVAIGALAGALVLLGADAALAQGGGEDVGRRLGGWVHGQAGWGLAGGGGGEDVGRRLGGWLHEQAVWVWLGVGAIGSIVFLINQRFGALIGWMAAFVLIGVPIVAPEQTKSFVESMATLLFG